LHLLLSPLLLAYHIHRLGLGVVGWGVGGIEAEAVMLDQPISMVLPEVIGYKLTGTFPPQATATDLVLTITKALRGISSCKISESLGYAHQYLRFDTFIKK